MKKSILAASIAAAVFGLGAVGAHAQVGGDIVLVPYFSAQGNNATLLSITNTDTANGKAVKVRFRGAANSDDIYDFQVFLSPTDVWTANVSKGADGRSVLKTSDASCTKPSASVLNSTPFVTGRLNPALTGDALANGTREGYIEILSMADIPKDYLTGSGVGTPVPGQANALPVLLNNGSNGGDGQTNTLYTAIKHVKSVAPCTGTAFTALDTVAWPMSTTVAQTKGMTPSTGGLIANWTIINTVNAAAWSGNAEAFPVTGIGKQVIYAPQTAAAVANSVATAWTADPLLTTDRSRILNGNYVSDNAALPIVAPGAYDFPDLSTPWFLPAADALNSPASVASALQEVLQTSSVVAEYMTDKAINGSTDWVFSMPTRRYSVAMAYSKISTGATVDDGRRFNTILEKGTSIGEAPGNGIFNRTNTSVTTTTIVGGGICVTGAKPVPYDREENTPASSTDVVVSPSSPTGGSLFCGETSVFSFNNGVGTTAALNASVAVSAADATYATGWASLAVGYPVLGGSFIKATNGAQGYGVYQPYRQAYTNR